MDYKKLIKSRSLRLKMLNLLYFVPDETMIKLQYRIKTGRKLNLKNPKRYTEKLQWYKINYKNPLMVQCVDKYDVRDYIKSIGLENILIPCLGVFDSAYDIDWDKLPEQFVLKDTLGGGGSSVVIVKNKRTEDIEKLVNTIEKWTHEDNRIPSGGREWPYYSGKKHRILIEEHIESDINNGGLIDYKFLCFNGKVELIYILTDRIIGKGAECGFFDAEFNQLPYTESDERPLTRQIPKPSNFTELKNIAEKIAKVFPCARIDLYNEKNKIMFGEITFFDSSGYMVFNPDDLDFILGERFVLRKE